MATATANAPVASVGVGDEPTFLKAPKACGDEFERVTWTDTISVRVDDNRYLGVRANSPEVLALITDCLGDRVDPDVEAPAFYSVRLGAAGRRHAAPLHHLHLGARPVLGTRSMARLLAGLASHISTHIAADHEDHAGYVVAATAVDSPRGLLLVPHEILAMTLPTDRLLTSAGFRFADVPHVRLDPTGPSVVIPEPAVRITAGEDRLTAAGPSAAEDWIAAGRYPLVGWLLGVGVDKVGPLSPMTAVLQAIRLVGAPLPAGAQAALDDIAAVVAAIPATGVTWSTSDELVEAVKAAGIA